MSEHLSNLEGHIGLAYSKIVAVLTGALQEQHTLIDGLQWYKSGPSVAGYRHVLPQGTTQVAAAFAAYHGKSKWRCNLRIFNASGAQVFFLERETYT